MKKIIPSQRVNRLEQHLDRCEKARFYSIQRIDLLIIAISTSGIIFSLKALTYIREEKLTDSFNSLLVWAISVYVLSIILNFISQWTAHSANVNEIKWTRCEIEKEEKSLKFVEGQEVCDYKSKLFNTATTILNYASTAALFAALKLDVVLLICIFNSF